MSSSSSSSPSTTGQRNLALPPGEYRIRTAFPDGRRVGRNFIEDRSMLPKRIVVHALDAPEEHVEYAARWTWDPLPLQQAGGNDAEDRPTPAAHDGATGTLTNGGWKAGPHDGKIKAHYYTDWIEDESGPNVQLRRVEHDDDDDDDDDGDDVGHRAAARTGSGADGASTGAAAGTEVYVVSASGTTFWAIAEAEGDVLAHLVAVGSQEQATRFVFERLGSAKSL